MFSRTSETSVASSILEEKQNTTPSYNSKIRVLFYESQYIQSNALQCANVNFVSRHKSLPGMEAVLSLCIKSNEASLSGQFQRLIQPNTRRDDDQGLTASIKSIHLRDPNNHLNQASEKNINSMISALLLAAYEYGDKRHVDEWTLNVAPFFKKLLTRFNIQQQQYGLDIKGRYTIGVNPYQFVHSAKHVLAIWNRRIFDYTLV